MSIFDGRDMIVMMHDLSAEAQACLDQKPQLDREAAEAEGRYRMTRKNVFLEYQAGGLSATAASIATDGDKKVVNAKIAWRCAESLAEANDEAHLLRKKEMGIVNDEIARSWAAAGVAR